MDLENLIIDNRSVFHSYTVRLRNGGSINEQKAFEEFIKDNLIFGFGMSVDEHRKAGEEALKLCTEEDKKEFSAVTNKLISLGLLETVSDGNIALSGYVEKCNEDLPKVLNDKLQIAGILNHKFIFIDYADHLTVEHLYRYGWELLSHNDTGFYFKRLRWPRETG